MISFRDYWGGKSFLLLVHMISLTVYLICCRGFGKQGYQCQGKRITDQISQSAMTICPSVWTLRGGTTPGHVLLVFQSVASSFTNDVMNTWALLVQGLTKELTRMWVPTIMLNMGNISVLSQWTIFSPSYLSSLSQGFSSNISLIKIEIFSLILRMTRDIFPFFLWRLNHVWFEFWENEALSVVFFTLSAKLDTFLWILVVIPIDNMTSKRLIWLIYTYDTIASREELSWY